MKIENPPRFNDVDFDKYIGCLKENGMESFLAETDKRYFYWSEIKYRPNLPLPSPEKAWEIIKTHRYIRAKKLLFGTHKFTYNLTSFIQEDLHNFDLKLIGGIYKNVITEREEQEYFKHSLIDEAIASSQIEGAATTTEVAKEMIKYGKKPRTESEQMIFNNLNAINTIVQRVDEDLSIDLILDIHQIMTVKTDASKYAGKFRDHSIYVKDHIDGEIAFTAPNFSEVNLLIKNLIHFINSEKEFYHPIIKAFILHFMIGFIHPFGDGNGRTARVFFYWYMMKKGYLLLRHISISKVILNSRTSYDKAFLKTEHDDNDLTYFIMYSMKSLKVAFQSLIHYRDRKREEKREASKIMYELTQKGFNNRQADLLAYLFAKPKAKITVPIYCERHNIVRQTASRDLANLQEKGIINKSKDGKTMVYTLINIQKIGNYI